MPNVSLVVFRRGWRDLYSYTTERVPVYNLSIPGSPTYYVGEHGVWVHNCNIAKAKSIRGKLRNASDKIKRELKRIDVPEEQYGQPHATHKEGWALNWDGTIRDKHRASSSNPSFSKRVRDWLAEQGWGKDD